METTPKRGPQKALNLTFAAKLILYPALGIGLQKSKNTEMGLHQTDIESSLGVCRLWESFFVGSKGNQKEHQANLGP